MDELTSIENVELPGLSARRPPRAARARAGELLEQVGLADRAEFLPSALSGGQRQRVAIARALINEPMIVLADGPTGNLDTSATVEVLRLFDSLHQSGQTLVIVTHDQRVAATAVGARFLQAEERAPTRPHRHAPKRPGAAVKAAGAAGAVIDAARDKLGDRPAERRGRAPEEVEAAGEGLSEEKR
jgi:ABC-type polar amino acid transport system ATPase subunit